MTVDPYHEFTDVLEQLCGPTATYTSDGSYPPVNNSGFVSNFAVAAKSPSPGDVMRCFSLEEYSIDALRFAPVILTPALSYPHRGIRKSSAKALGRKRRQDLTTGLTRFASLISRSLISRGRAERSSSGLFGRQKNPESC